MKVSSSPWAKMGLPDPVETKGQLRLKAFTLVLTVGIGASLLLMDWSKEGNVGEKNVFSEFRPAVKSAISRLYSGDPPEKRKA
mmetsp:Transcript_52658/g.167375  ORF Transcript_52658/g.167375 Transcript_52658/m.167375 type:complete len:83 (+) Transcript_52658:49-297(+)